jgi:hypothetical protein
MFPLLTYIEMLRDINTGFGVSEYRSELQWFTVDESSRR